MGIILVHAITESLKALSSDLVMPRIEGRKKFKRFTVLQSWESDSRTVRCVPHCEESDRREGEIGVAEMGRRTPEKHF